MKAYKHMHALIKSGHACTGCTHSGCSTQPIPVYANNNYVVTIAVKPNAIILSFVCYSLIYVFLTIIELEANHSMLLNNFIVGFLAAFVVVSLVLMLALLVVVACAVNVCRKKIITYRRRKMSDDASTLIR